MLAGGKAEEQHIGHHQEYHLQHRGKEIGNEIEHRHGGHMPREMGAEHGKAIVKEEHQCGNRQKDQRRKHHVLSLCRACGHGKQGNHQGGSQVEEQSCQIAAHKLRLPPDGQGGIVVGASGAVEPGKLEPGHRQAIEKGAEGTGHRQAVIEIPRQLKGSQILPGE